MGLPVRGQRTKTNARTRKGPKRTVAGKKKPVKSKMAHVGTAVKGADKKAKPKPLKPITL